MAQSSRARYALAALLASTLPVRVLAGNILSTDGFTSCLPNATIQVQKMDISFDRSTNIISFNVAGTSTQQQNVSASLEVTAYGQQVYSNTFNPCDQNTFVAQLCPVPAGTFAAQGSQKIPPQYASLIPSIAYTVPDLDGDAKLELKSADNGTDMACIQSSVTNDKTFTVPGVSYAAAAIAGGALAVSAIGAFAAVGGGTAAGGGNTGAATSSPTFTEVIHWFQGMAMNGMLSVQYPSLYRSFTRNFGFSVGLIPWDTLQSRFDSFRAATGGNLTDDNIEFLKNSTLVFQTNTQTGLTKRDLVEHALLFARDITTSINGTQTNVTAPGGTGNTTANSTGNNQQMAYVSGIQAYVEQLTVPQANAFLTILLVFSIILAAIVAGILLFKVILETWSLFGTFPKRLTSFRKNYWWILAKTITNLIFLLYGVWTLYCIYQFSHGDSWAAKLLAAITFFLFTTLLAIFTWRIWHLAQKYKKMEGDTNALYEKKEIWVKYSIFYDNYKKNYWFLFVPAIIYMFAKGCVIAVADGHGMAQCAGQLIVESIYCVLILFLRPYTMKSGNWINIVIQVVRVISVICILVFVEELGIAQTTKTVTGLILIVVQSVLTAVLAVLIGVNAIINCVRMNPHRRERKENEKFRDLDTLTPLDAHNSLLLQPMDDKTKAPLVSIHSRGQSANGYDMLPMRDEAQVKLMSHGAPMGHSGRDSPFGRDRSPSPSLETSSLFPTRSGDNRRPSWASFHGAPKLPDLENLGGHGGHGGGIGHAM